MSPELEDLALSALVAYVDEVRTTRDLARRLARIEKAHASDRSQYRKLDEDPTKDPDYVPSDPTDKPIGDSAPGGPSLHAYWSGEADRCDGYLRHLVDEITKKTDALKNRQVMYQEGRGKPKGAQGFVARVVREARKQGWQALDGQPEGVAKVTEEEPQLDDKVKRCV